MAALQNKKTVLPSSEKQRVLNAGKFFFLVIVFFAALNAIASLMPVIEIEKFIAGIIGTGLALGGVSVQLGADANAFIQITGGPRIIINELCTGLLETLVLISAILATFEINWKKRITGALAGIIGIFVFNLVRIWVTITAILTQPVEMVVLSHEVLFRVFLFIVIAGFYWAWLQSAQK